MKRLIMLILVMTALVACGQEENEAPDVEKTEEAESKTNKENNREDEKETKNETENGATEENNNQDISKGSEDNEVHIEKNNDNNKDKSEEQNSNNETVEKPAEKPSEKPSEKPEKEPAEKNEKVEVATENIIWAQNDRDYATLKGYLGQNITLDEKNKLLKITNVDYPHEAELLEGIKKENLEHRFTEEKGNDRIVGFAVTDYETELSYTIDFTMRVGKDSWKMLNMQVNK